MHRNVRWIREVPFICLGLEGNIVNLSNLDKWIVTVLSRDDWLRLAIFPFIQEIRISMILSILSLSLCLFHERSLAAAVSLTLSSEIDFLKNKANVLRFLVTFSCLNSSSTRNGSLAPHSTIAVIDGLINDDHHPQPPLPLYLQW